MTTDSGADLLSYGRNVTSEHGEDGVIGRMFDILGTDSKWCAELGALNGVHGSNVWQLLKHEGWSGVLLEADQTYFEKLQQEFAGMPQVHGIQSFVSFEGPTALDVLFAQTPMPKHFDLFSLDVDGNEYHLWESMHEYRPRVMVVEFNPTIPNDVVFVQPRDMTVFQGASLAALITLGKQKGYELVAANETNAFFVERELFPRFNIADNSIDALHTDTQFQTKLFQLYDGTLKISGNTTLLWHAMPISEEALQVLPAGRRRYPARISASDAVRRLKYWVRTMPFYSPLQAIRKRLF